jgi:hypothetical protein
VRGGGGMRGRGGGCGREKGWWLKCVMARVSCCVATRILFANLSHTRTPPALISLPFFTCLPLLLRPASPRPASCARQGLKGMGSNLSDKDILRLFKDSDLDGNGSIDYQVHVCVCVCRRIRCVGERGGKGGERPCILLLRTRAFPPPPFLPTLPPSFAPSLPPPSPLSQEFLMVNVERTKNECENRLKDAFAHFDKDKGSGKINQETLWQVGGQQERKGAREEICAALLSLCS